MRTIQTTQQVGNLQRMVNAAQPHHVIGTAQQQVIQHQPRIVGNAQVIGGTQPATARVTQPHLIQMSQLQPGDNKVSVVPHTVNMQKKCMSSCQRLVDFIHHWPYRQVIKRQMPWGGGGWGGG